MARLINALDAATESAAAEVFRLTAALEASEADRRDLISQVGARLLVTLVWASTWLLDSLGCLVGCTMAQWFGNSGGWRRAAHQVQGAEEQPRKSAACACALAAGWRSDHVTLSGRMER